MARTVSTLSSMLKPWRKSSLLSSTRISNWTTRYAFLVETKQRYERDPHQFSYEADRQLGSYAEPALILEVMQDGEPRSSPSLSCSQILGRTNRTSVKQLKYFFENQTFGPDFYRRGSSADVTVLAPVAAAILNGHPVPYGTNAPNGTYITDTPPQPNFVSPTSLSHRLEAASF